MSTWKVPLSGQSRRGQGVDGASSRSGYGADGHCLVTLAALQLNLFKRGTARLALGQTKKALDDFQGVLALTEFDQVGADS